MVRVGNYAFLNSEVFLWVVLYHIVISLVFSFIVFHKLWFLLENRGLKRKREGTKLVHILSKHYWHLLFTRSVILLEGTGKLFEIDGMDSINKLVSYKLHWLRASKTRRALTLLTAKLLYF
jgi:hypothetical protein